MGPDLWDPTGVCHLNDDFRCTGASPTSICCWNGGPWWTMVDRQIQVEPGIKTDEFSIVQAEDIFDKYGTHTHIHI